MYTNKIKRDIQKRYYLKYPNWAYIIGKGTEYEVLYIDNAVAAMVEWVAFKPDGKTRVIKDEHRINTAEAIKEEKAAGRAKYVLRFPRWVIMAGYGVLKIAGKNKFTYLLNKALYPLRTK